MSFEKILKDTGIFITAFYNEKLFLTIRQETKKKDFIFDFNPYFYISTKNQLNKDDFEILNKNLKGIFEIIKTKKKNHPNLYKLDFKDLESLIISKQKLQEHDFKLSCSFSLKEQDISFIQRFFIDFNLSCFKKISFTYKDNKILSFKVLEDVLPENLSHLTFDIEVLPLKDLSFPKPKNSPIISICSMDEKYNKKIFFLKDISFKKENLKKNNLEIYFYTNEAIMIESFLKHLNNKNPDLLFTYNGDRFDFDYLNKRYKILTSKELPSNINFHKRGNLSVSLNNSIHIDTYILIKLLNYLQIFNYSKLDLTSVYENITGKKKLTLDVSDLRKAYLSFDYNKIIDYNIDDVLATYYLSKNYLSIINEISKLVSAPIFNILRISAGQMIEKLFILNYFKKDLIIEDKPNTKEISERHKFSFTGAFVKDPIPGIHDNIAIVDFRSYHISILMAYNISFDTINIDSKEYHEILGYKISKNKKGFVPEILENFLNLRIDIKNQMMQKDPKTQEFKNLFAKQYALKILLASTYGYMGFSGARWYCRSCLEIMYHLVRTKIQETINDFESLGYTVIYSDTDSCFIKFKDLNKLKEDIKKINKSFPKHMSLETEDIFVTGLFVMSRDKKKGAKKKYVLLSKDGSLKIKGFEFVRRGWCPLVKEIQKELFLILLKSKDIDKAVKYVREKINNLENKKTPLEKLVLQAYIHKKIKNYKTINPATYALSFAKKQGKEIFEKDLVEYIITNEPSKSISKKARLYDLNEKQDYDTNYYLENQLLPSVLSILDVYNISKDELLTGKKQKGLNDFFK